MKVASEAGAVVANCRMSSGKWPVDKSEVKSCTEMENDLQFSDEKYCAIDVDLLSESEAVLKVEVAEIRKGAVYCTKPVSFSMNVDGDNAKMVFIEFPESSPKRQASGGDRKKKEVIENKLNDKLKEKSDEPSSN